MEIAHQFPFHLSQHEVIYCGRCGTRFKGIEEQNRVIRLAYQYHNARRINNTIPGVEECSALFKGEKI